MRELPSWRLYNLFRCLLCFPFRLFLLPHSLLHIVHKTRHRIRLNHGNALFRISPATVCHSLFLNDWHPHTKSIWNPTILKPPFRENMFLIKDAGRTIKLISRSIFHKFNKSLGSLHQTERYIYIFIFIKLIQRDIIYQK